MTGPEAGSPETNSGVDLDPELLEMIVCPACRAELDLVTEGVPAGTDAELACRGCGLVYPVRDGIPVLLVDAARTPR